MKLSSFPLFAMLALQTLAPSAHAIPGATISGEPFGSLLHFNIERICIANPVLAGNPVTKYFEKKLDVGVFRAAFNLEDKNKSSIKTSPIRDFSAISFSELAKEKKKGPPGSIDYIFDQFRFSIPIQDIEKFAVNQIPRQNADSLFGPLNQDSIQTLGIYVRARTMSYIPIDNVVSYLAFRGKNSNIATDLMGRDKDGLDFYYRIWPGIASLLSPQRSILTVQDKHENERTAETTDCTTKSFIKYSVEIKSPR